MVSIRFPFSSLSGDGSKKSSDATPKGKAAAKRLSARQLRTQKAQVVVLPLSDLEPLLTDPGRWLVVKGSFNAALESKLSSWWVSSADEEGGAVNQVLKFKEDWKDMLEHDDVKQLPIDDVCRRCTLAAVDILEFQEKMKSWSIPCGVAKYRTDLEQLFIAYDKALEELHSYAVMIDGLGAKMDIDADKVKSKHKNRMKNCRDSLFHRMCNENIPKVLAKVVDEQNT